MGHSRSVDAVAVKGSLAVSAGEDYLLCLHQQEGKNWIFSKSINLKKAIYSLEIIDDEKLLVQTLGNKLITIDKEGKVIEEASLGSERISAKSGDVKVLESDGAIILANGEKYEAHQNGIRGLITINDVIYTWSYDGTIVEYKGKDTRFQRKSQLDGASSVVEYKGKVAVLTYEGKLIDLDKKELLTDVRLKGGCQMAINHDDDLCVINASNALVRINASVEVTEGQFVAIGGDFVADNDKKIYALGNDSNFNEPLFTHAPGMPTSIVASPDKRYIAIGDDQRRIKIYSTVESYKQLHSWQYHAAKVTHLIWLNQDILMSAGQENDLFAWKVGKDEPVAHLKGILVFTMMFRCSLINNFWVDQFGWKYSQLWARWNNTSVQV